METLLIAVTVVSLGVALAMSVLAWRATQGEKQRAAARVAALAAAAQIPAAVDAAQPQPAPWRNPAPTPIEGPASFLRQARAAQIVEPLVEPSPVGAVRVQSSFLGADAPIRESQQHQRWLRAAAAVLALVLGTVVYIRMSSHGVAPATQAHAAPAPLELLSLRHEREGVNLSVAGLVRNPATGGVVERVTAVVYLFDQQGAFVTSAKAPIDFLKLTAGDESPFVVKVAAPPSVARYRVSFRTDDGTLTHVDRRGEPPAAAPAALTRHQ